VVKHSLPTTTICPVSLTDLSPDHMVVALYPKESLRCHSHWFELGRAGARGRVGLVAELTVARGGSASVYVLHEGYVGRDGDDERVAGTVTLIMDGDAVIVVDPGMVAGRAFAQVG
jgi:hypothetical protein